MNHVQVVDPSPAPFNYQEPPQAFHNHNCIFLEETWHFVDFLSKIFLFQAFLKLHFEQQNWFVKLKLLRSSLKLLQAFGNFQRSNSSFSGNSSNAGNSSFFKLKPKLETITRCPWKKRKNGGEKVELLAAAIVINRSVEFGFQFVLRSKVAQSHRDWRNWGKTCWKREVIFHGRQFPLFGFVSSWQAKPGLTIVIVIVILQPPIYEEVPKPATAPKGWLEKTVMSKIAMAAELPKKTPDWVSF